MGVLAACGSAHRARGVYRLYGCVIGLAFSTGLLPGCATGAYQQGERAARIGDWDAAVASYRRALQEEPGRADVRIALERTKQRAIWGHLDTARDLEARDEPTAALAEYRQALTYDPSNGRAIDRLIAIEREIREWKTALLARRQAVAPIGLPPLPPLLDLGSQEPIYIQFRDASLKDILNFIGDAAGITVIYDEQFQDRPYSVQLDGVTLEEALDVILTANQYFYKVLYPRGIRVTSGTVSRAR